MPTTRARHVITETDPVTEALAEAARRWPGESSSRLLTRLIDEGHQSLVRQVDAERRRRLQALAETSGMLTGVYPVGYLDRLREDWPE